MPGVVFHQKQADETGAQLLSLEEPRVRRLSSELPRAVRGQPIPIVRLLDLPAEIRGTWSLWRIALYAGDERQLRVLPVFRHDDGRSLGPTARHIWDQLLSRDRIEPLGHLDGDHAISAYDGSFELAKRLGQGTFAELLQQHRRRLDRDREKTEFAVARRAQAIKRIGLTSVRQHRLDELNREAHTLRASLAQRAQVAPELDPVVLVRVESGA
jgi:hypothetical protein